MPTYEFPGKPFRVLTMEPMKRHTRFRVGGPADLLALPESEKQLKGLIQWAQKQALPVTIIGGGSNLLVPDRGIQGLVVSLKALKPVMTVQHPSHVIETGAGVRLSRVVQFAMDLGLSGLEFAAGIPGTVGGAVMMNAGSASQGIGQIVGSITVMDLGTLKLVTLKDRDLNFSYRNLDLTNRIVVRVRLKLTPGEPDQIRQATEQNLLKKKQTQPVAMASGGCFFKNPSVDRPAGRLIEEAGLKGLAVNDAVVSSIHANYIVNRGNASCKEILTLARMIQEKVFDTFKIHLEPEVKVMDNE